jgi:hypothetical protein
MGMLLMGACGSVFCRKATPLPYVFCLPCVFFLEALAMLPFGPRNVARSTVSVSHVSSTHVYTHDTVIFLGFAVFDCFCFIPYNSNHYIYIYIYAK